MVSGRGLSPGDEELQALLVLRLLPGLGDVGVGALLERFGSGRAALVAPPSAFAAVVGGAPAESRGHEEPREVARRALERARELGIRVVGRGRPGYPRRLEALHDPPAVLFLRGDPALVEPGPAVAVVGTRRATAYGRRVTGRLAAGLAGRGIRVVSGMALGVDGAAHRGALKAGGDTVAVLGSGPDRASPSSHRGLYRSIVEQGLVVSEFLPGEAPFPHHFPRRNRIIAALADAVVVVEAGKRSGAFITVDHALDLGREVFAVPGSVESRSSVGTHALIQEGAYLLTGVDELLESMGWTGSPAAGPRRRPAPLVDGDRVLLRVLETRGRAPVHVDELVRASGIQPSRVMATLSRLEVDGWVVQLPGSRFVRSGEDLLR